MNTSLLARATALRSRLEEILGNDRRHSYVIYRGDMRAVLYATKSLEKDAEREGLVRESFWSATAWLRKSSAVREVTR